MTKLQEAIQRLHDLKCLNHHKIDEEIWRIDGIIELLVDVNDKSVKNDNIRSFKFESS